MSFTFGSDELWYNYVIHTILFMELKAKIFNYSARLEFLTSLSFGGLSFLNY